MLVMRIHTENPSKYASLGSIFFCVLYVNIYPNSVIGHMPCNWEVRSVQLMDYLNTRVSCLMDVI
jgi:hypothetical protein